MSNIKNAYPFLKSKTNKWLLIFVILSINCFAFSYLPLDFYQKLHLIIFAFLIYATIFIHRQLPEAFHKKSILLMMLLPLLSVYSCNALHGQSYTASLIVYRMHLGWLCYFALWNKKVTINQVYKIIFFVGIVYALLTLIQQVTYPFAPFGTRTVGTAYAEMAGWVEKRMGFYRFAVGGLNYAIIAFFICLTYKKTNLNYAIIGILAISFIACGNRQTMFSVFIAFCYYLLYNKKVKHRLLIIICLSITVYLLYYFADVIFGSLVNVKDDFENARLVSVIFFWGEVTHNWMSLLFGNGLGHSSSAYGNEVYYIDGQRAIFSDIGMLGTMYLWGALYVATYYILALRMFFNKDLSTHLKAVLLSFLVSSPLAPFLFEIGGMLLQGILFYICDLDIYNNKNKTRKNENCLYRR